MSLIGRLAATLGVMVSTGVVAAIVIALYNMDRNGHGKISILESPATSQMSVGDVALLVVVAIASIVTWIVTGRG